MNCKLLFVINYIFIEIQVKFSVIRWIVLQHIYVRFFILCYQKFNYWTIIFNKHWAIVTNLYWFKFFCFSVFFWLYYVNIYIEEEKPRWTFWFYSHISIYRIDGGIEWTRLWHHQRERRKRKNNNKIIFPIFHQTISYKWTENEIYIYPLDV